jgi:acetylglutamate kinase
MATNRDARQTIVQLLSNMSDSKEIRTYLRRFSEVDQARFAVIKVGGAILRDRLDETAAALAFLHTVGLTPIVLHGGGPQLDAKLKSEGLEAPKLDGLRVTSESVLDAARETFTAENIKLVEAVRAQGVSAHGLTTGAFDAKFVDEEKYGFVGEPVNVHLDLLRSIVSSGAIPILSCLGVAPGGQLVNMNADSATRLLVHAVQPMKIIFLVDSGGLLDADRDVIESINLASDYEDLLSQDWVHSGMRLKLSEIKLLLDDSDPSASVSISTPSGLVRELFTHGGDGTMVRKGEQILTLSEKGSLDRGRTTDLVENAFKRNLRESWWDQLNLSTAYISESHRAGALITDVSGFTYLDKFAIHESARGEGLARTVWSLIEKNHEQLVWRSRSTNSFNSFYHDEADGSVRRGEWTVFWKGLTEFEAIARAVEAASAVPEAFEVSDV